MTLLFLGRGRLLVLHRLLRRVITLRRRARRRIALGRIALGRVASLRGRVTLRRVTTAKLRKERSVTVFGGPVDSWRD